jgi:hypothetical protein
MTAQTRTHVLRSCGRLHLLQDLETQTNDQLGGALLPVATGAVPDVAGQSCCNMTPKRGKGHHALETCVFTAVSAGRTYHYRASAGTARLRTAPMFAATRPIRRGCGRREVRREREGQQASLARPPVSAGKSHRRRAALSAGVQLFLHARNRDAFWRRPGEHLSGGAGIGRLRGRRRRPSLSAGRRRCRRNGLRACRTRAAR